MGNAPRSNLIPAERQDYIADLVRRKRTISVSALSEALRVSEVTIRRDLERLEALGILERTHGGAVLTQHLLQEPLYIHKDQLHLEAKQAIGRAAAQLVSEGDTIFVNSGSTTRQLFAHLAQIARLRVVTSNVAALSELTNGGKERELVLLGGVHRWQSNSLVGPLALSTIAQINASKAFLGVDGITVQHGLTTPILDEAAVARAMIERTHGPVVVLADHTKFGVVAEFTTCPLSRVHTVVTDAGLDDDWRQTLEAQGVRLIVADAAT